MPILIIVFTLLFTATPHAVASATQQNVNPGLWLARGEQMQEQGKKQKALLYYTTAASRYADNLPANDKRACATALLKAGQLCHASLQLTAAMNHYLAGLRICQANHFSNEMCKLYMGIGNLYSSQADYNMGIRFYTKALNLTTATHDVATRNKVLNNLVGAECFAGNARRGEHYYRLMAATRDNSPEHQYNLLMCRGLILSYSHHLGAAAASYHRAIGYAERKLLAHSCIDAARACLAQLYDEAGLADSALVYLNMNERTARASRQYDLLEETLRHKAAVYAKKGRQAAAMACKTAYVELADSVRSKEDFNNMKNTQFLFEARQSQTAIMSLTEQNINRQRVITLQRICMITLIVAVIIVVLMLYVVHRQKKQLSQAYNELFDRSQALIAPQGGKQTAVMLSETQKQQLLERITTAMQNADVFCNPDFSIDKLATLVSSNTRYVSEAINEGYGKNFRSFLNEYRIREAMRRLSNHNLYGGYTIKAIAESVGYKSQANFITVFTKVTGMKPSVYQKISQQRNKPQN